MEEGQQLIEFKNIERFTQAARRVLQFAAEEATSLGQSSIKPEHVLIGLLREDGRIGGKVLKSLGFTVTQAREAIHDLSFTTSSDEDGTSALKLDLDSLTREALSNAVDESKRLDRHYIGTEHLLLGLTRLEEGAIPSLFEKLGISPNEIREAVKDVLYQTTSILGQAFYQRADLDIIPVLKGSYKQTTTTKLQEQLNVLQTEIQKLKDPSRDNKTTQQVERITQIANELETTGLELSAPILLPPMEDMNVKLVPSHSLERLEEYRSDEGIAMLLVGLFGGAMLGVLANWATNENMIITRFSLVLLGIFAVLLILCVLWTIRLHGRSSAVRERLFRHNITTTHLSEE